MIENCEDSDLEEGTGRVYKPYYGSESPQEFSGRLLNGKLIGKVTNQDGTQSGFVHNDKFYGPCKYSLSSYLFIFSYQKDEPRGKLDR